MAPASRRLAAMKEWNDSILHVLPPSIGESIAIPKYTIIVCCYFLLFMIGVSGNAAVLTCIAMIRNIVARVRDNVLVYVTVLCFVDFAALLSLPFAIADIMMSTWIFGPGFCKLYWILESSGKIMPTLILTAVSFERYMATCHIGSSPKFRSRCSAACVVLCSAVISLTFLSPLAYFAELRYVNVSAVHELRFKSPEGKTEKLPVQFAYQKCLAQFQSIQSWWPNFYTHYCFFLFVIGFLVPGTLISCFYFRMLWVLRRHRQRLPRSQIPLGAVARYTVAVTAFYFLCWTPYWITIIYNTFKPEWANDDRFVTMMYVVHALPYCNSAFNWIIYVVLNSQIRRSYRAASRCLTSDMNYPTYGAADSIARGRDAPSMSWAGEADERTGFRGIRRRSTYKTGGTSGSGRLGSELTTTQLRYSHSVHLHVETHGTFGPSEAEL